MQSIEQKVDVNKTMLERLLQAYYLRQLSSLSEWELEEAAKELQRIAGFMQQELERQKRIRGAL